MTMALIFPGQGSQSPGMGKALAENFAVARHVFEQVDNELDQDLAQLMFEGPEAELTLTSNAQPALMAVSIAVLRVLEAETGLDVGRDAAFVAGHSLGEYSALVAAGSFEISDAARLLRLRGDAMQRAVEPGEGAMAALLGLADGLAAQIASDAADETGGTCDIANDNGGGQIVVSGTRAAVGRAMELAKARGAKRAIALAVSAPFHCSLMHPAAAEMEIALRETGLRKLRLPLVSNVTAKSVMDPTQIAPLLVRQITQTVRWRESVAYMADQGVTQFWELGNGRVLSGLVKRIAADANAHSAGTPADIERFRNRT